MARSSASVGIICEYILCSSKCLFTKCAVVGISARLPWALPQVSGEEQNLQLTLPVLIPISHSAVFKKKKKIGFKTDKPPLHCECLPCLMTDNSITFPSTLVL